LALHHKKEEKNQTASPVHTFLFFLKKPNEIHEKKKFRQGSREKKKNESRLRKIFLVAKKKATAAPHPKQARGGEVLGLQTKQARGRVRADHHQHKREAEAKANVIRLRNKIFWWLSRTRGTARGLQTEDLGGTNLFWIGK